MKTISKLPPKIILKFCFVIFLYQFALPLDVTVLSEDKIYTNEDLKQESSTSSRSTHMLEPIVKTSGFNSSFDELHRYIEDKLSNIRIPEYKIYLRPLSSGMTQEQVNQLWGPKTKGGMHEQNDSNTWSVDIKDYEIGISLFFKNNQLKGWKIYNQPRYTNRKDTNVIDYKDLMEKSRTDEKTTNEHVQEYRGLKEDEEIKVSIRGCQTLQEAIDRKPGNTNAIISVIRHWRTIQEVCETLGQGCKACEEYTKR